jgi:hypothetical protein
MPKIDLLKPAIKQINKIKKEDFSIDVGAPAGLNQGIPSSGDAIGVMPIAMPMSKPTIRPNHIPLMVNTKPFKKKKRKLLTTIHQTKTPVMQEKQEITISFPKMTSFSEYIKDKL